jgi:hypothetical protein
MLADSAGDVDWYFNGLLGDDQQATDAGFWGRFLARTPSPDISSVEGRQPRG